MVNVTIELMPDGEHITWSHDCINGHRRADILPYEGGPFVIVSTDPLTMTPSIHCPMCKVAGWITNGEWVLRGQVGRKKRPDKRKKRVRKRT